MASYPFVLQLDSEDYTLAEAFNDVGYKTMLTEKWLLAEQEKYNPQYQNFDMDIAGNTTWNPAAGCCFFYKTLNIEYQL